MPPLISVVLPTLNEAENIGLLIEALYAAVPTIGEIIVVDDESQDGTAEVVRTTAGRHPEWTIRLEERRETPGLTNSLRHGIACSRGDIVVWMDCDFSMPPADIPRLLRCLDQGYDIAVGSRFVRGGSFKQNTEGTPDSPVAVFLSRVMNYSIQFFLYHTFKDYTSGYIAVRKEVLERVPLRGDYGEYFIDLMFRAIRAGYRFIEVPYICLPRVRGESKTGQTLFQYLKRGTGYLKTALRLRWEAMTTPRATPLNRPVLAMAPRSDIRLVSMSTEHVPLVAGLHHQVLYETLNSRLGIPLLEDLYGSLFLDTRARGWVALDGERVVGFVTVTTDLHATQKQVSSSLYWRDRFVAAAHILTSLRDLRDVLSHQALSLYTRYRLGRPYATILTLGVAPAYEGQGVGQRLMAEVHAHFVSAHVDRYYVDTLSHNDRALTFYRKNGFNVVGSVVGNTILRRIM